MSVNGWARSKGGLMILGLIAFAFAIQNIFIFMDSAVTGNVDVISGYCAVIFAIGSAVMTDELYKKELSNRDIWTIISVLIAFFSAGLLIVHWGDHPIMTNKTVPFVVAILIACIIGTVHVARNKE